MKTNKARAKKTEEMVIPSHGRISLQIDYNILRNLYEIITTSRVSINDSPHGITVMRDDSMIFLSKSFMTSCDMKEMSGKNFVIDAGEILSQISDKEKFPVIDILFGNPSLSMEVLIMVGGIPVIRTKMSETPLLVEDCDVSFFQGLMRRNMTQPISQVRGTLLHNNDRFLILGETPGVRMGIPPEYPVYYTSNKDDSPPRLFAVYPSSGCLLARVIAISSPNYTGDRELTE